MTARSKKETRPLLLPWGIAMVAALLFPTIDTLTRYPYSNNGYFGGLPLEWFGGLIRLSLFVGCMALAAIPFGIEFQHRTFALILVQPVERLRLWKAKMASPAVAFVAVGLAYVVGECFACLYLPSSSPSWSAGDVCLPMFFLFGILCSSAYWTLLSRSIIGGMVLPLAAQVGLAVLIGYLVSWRTGDVFPTASLQLFVALGIGALVYCSLFAYLGWRKFARMECREALLGSSVFEAAPAGRESAPLQPIPSSGPWRGLLRKELRLQRTVFLLASFFAVCWFAALGLERLRPAWKDQFEAVHILLLVIYLPLGWLLAGCISLGEEKSLGTWGWHLTLPVSAWRQWAMKLAIALAVMSVAGLALPGLAWFAAQGFKIDRPGRWFLEASPVVLLAVYGAILSFWAVTMLGNVIRAVLASLMAVGVLFLGGMLMVEIGGRTSFQQELCAWIVVQFQLSPWQFGVRELTFLGSIIGLLLLLALLLRQSYVHCRREPSRAVLIKCSLGLMVSLFLPLWWGADLVHSFRSPVVNAVVEQLREAMMQLPSRMPDRIGVKATTVSLEELDATGSLDSQAKRWLRGATIAVSKWTPAGVYQSSPLLTAQVTFPGGRSFTVQCAPEWVHQPKGT